MFESHFGFSGPPFQLNPDPAFYFESRGHAQAMAYLKYGTFQGEGFIVITGEIGAGKTTLVRTLIEGLDKRQIVPAQVVSTQLDADELLVAICTAFGLDAGGQGKAQLLATLEAYFTALTAQGRRALLIVDEAQNLTARAVEELRMLSNFQLGPRALLQSFLVGQPELRRILQQPSMEQLRQRVIASCHLGPLSADETRAYIEHRLCRVGWRGRPYLDDTAYLQIHRDTGGVPRRINQLCNRVLLSSYLESHDALNAGDIARITREMETELGLQPASLTNLPVA
jgi:putative secretion ATPase (PEP-CTERM system associated)